MTTPKAAALYANPRISPYQLFMLALCLWAILSLAAEAVLQIDFQTRVILDYADNVICALFFVDFVWTFFTAPSRTRYLMTWGWLDLLSSIPAINVLRLGRVARVVRILRVVRGVKSARLIAKLVLERRAQSAFLAVLLLTMLLIVFASIAVLQFELAAGGNIRNAHDALWWALSTLTTVGYGDVYPTTSEGRLVAAALMVAGVGLFGTLSGMVASLFLAPQRALMVKQEAEQSASSSGTS